MWSLTVALALLVCGAASTGKVLYPRCDRAAASRDAEHIRRAVMAADARALLPSIMISSEALARAVCDETERANLALWLTERPAAPKSEESLQRASRVDSVIVQCDNLGDCTLTMRVSRHSGAFSATWQFRGPGIASIRFGDLAL